MIRLLFPFFHNMFAERPLADRFERRHSLFLEKYAADIIALRFMIQTIGIVERNLGHSYFSTSCANRKFRLKGIWFGSLNVFI